MGLKSLKKLLHKIMPNSSAPKQDDTEISDIDINGVETNSVEGREANDREAQRVEEVEAQDKIKANVDTEESLKQDVEIATGKKLQQKQMAILFLGLGCLIAALCVLLLFTHSKIEKKKAAVEEDPEIKVELADKALDADKMWRNYHEENLQTKSQELQAQIDELSKTAASEREDAIMELKEQISSLKEQLNIARRELYDASGNLGKLAELEQQQMEARINRHEASNLGVKDFADETQYDIPKSAATYVPEGTYFTGYLLGGLVVSTSLNTADDNPVPVTIILKGRGNLSESNKTDISKCKIEGSAYGDLSSERAIVRLEKLVCEKDGMYITSHIAGIVHGPDGFNGIKGTVVATSSKHIKNAALGGIISGLSSSVKGQDGMSITSGGVVNTNRKGFKDMVTAGGLTGASNAGDKIAEFYLKQAEAMSPVLTIPGGVRVNPKIEKGFFMGEIGTHKKIKQQREQSAGAHNTSSARGGAYGTNYQSGASYGAGGNSDSNNKEEEDAI